MSESTTGLPLNAIRVFVMIARQQSVTRAAMALGITQSAASRHLAVLERYLGAELIERRGRHIWLTDFGSLFAQAVGEPLDSIAFTVQRMRRGRSESNRLVVRTSLSTFAYTVLIPNLQRFSAEADGAVVDIVTSLSQPAITDEFDVLITRDLAVNEPSDHWDLLKEQLVCAGSPHLVAGKDLSAVRTTPILAITSRPDILPRWLTAMNLTAEDIRLGARYDHHYLALPAVTTGQGLLVGPEIVIADLVKQGLLDILPGSRTPSGMHYRAFSVDRSSNPDLARAFCRWLMRLCR
jgi:LysR family glycine cleavage system transcriptional activator